MLKFEFLKQFHAKHNNVKKISLLLIKFWNGFVIKTLVCLHDGLGSNLDGCVH
jgi:hypothetical protein